MTFLAPWTALIAAAASLPLLIVLYFLKLRRQTKIVSSTLLWRKAVQDLQVNAPFQRMRKSLLLLLQLLAMVLVLLALSRPVVRLSMGPGKRYVLLIDRSASMQATDVQPSRLEEAKNQARLVVRSLRGQAGFGGGASGDQAMVVAFDEHAKVMCNFTSDQRQLEAAIDAIGATDGRSMLSEALTVARAFAQPAGGETNNRSSETPAQLELFSDGRIADAERVTLASGEMNFHRVGVSGDNLAVVAMQARRNFEKPSEVEVFATLANFAPRAGKTDLQLSLDGQMRSVRSLDVPPFRPPEGRSPGGPGLASLSFTLTHDEPGVLEVRQMRADSLAGDDAAWAILPPPRRLNVMLVTAGNAPLRSALGACPLQKLDVVSPSDFAAMDVEAMTVKPPADVYILDNVLPARLPRGRFLVFGKPVAQSGATYEQELRDQVVVDWRSRHAVLQYVNMGNLYAARAYKLKLGPEAVVLAEFGAGPALAAARREGSLFLLAPFDTMQTNWPFEPSFVLFCYNATIWLGLEMGQDAQADLRVNQAISLEQLPPGAAARVSAPPDRKERLTVSPSGTVHYPGTGRCGVYTVEVDDRPPRRVAVNLLEAAESEIAPAGSLRLMGQEVAASAPAQPGNMELWPLLASLALLLALGEWIVYNRKAHL